MDTFDQKILAALQKNARQSVSSIAQQVNLSRSAVSERIKRMEESGEILGYEVITAPHNTQHQVRAYFEVRQKGYQCAAIAKALLELPEVKYCHGTSGELDIIAYLELPHMQRLHEIRTQLDQQFSDTVKVVTHIVMQEWDRKGHKL